MPATPSTWSTRRPSTSTSPIFCTPSTSALGAPATRAPWRQRFSAGERSQEGRAPLTLPPVGGEGRPPSRSDGGRGGGTTLAHAPPLKKLLAQCSRRPPPLTPPHHSLRSRGEGYRERRASGFM